MSLWHVLGRCTQERQRDLKQVANELDLFGFPLQRDWRLTIESSACETAVNYKTFFFAIDTYMPLLVGGF